MPMNLYDTVNYSLNSRVFHCFFILLPLIIMASVGISLVAGAATRFLAGALNGESGDSVERVQGTRIDNLDVQKSEYGVSIPKAYGKWRLNGLNVFWSPPIDVQEEVVTETTSSNGKGGGGSQTTETVNQVAFGNFAVIMCEPPSGNGIHKVVKVWLNGNLVYNDGVVVPGSETEEASNAFVIDNMAIYTGSSSQAPDPLIISTEGITEDRPYAYPFIAYLVFKNLPLAPYGNRVPKVDVQIEATDGELTLADIVEDLCLMAGMEPNEFDASSLETTIIEGYVFKNDGTTIRQHLEELMEIFLFYMREQDGKLVFRLFNDFNIDFNNEVIKLDYEELGCHEYDSDPNKAYVLERSHDIEIPSEVQLEYKNSDSDFQSGFAQAGRQGIVYKNPLNLRTEIALTDEVAVTQARRLLETRQIQKTKISSVYLSPKRRNIQPGQIIELAVEQNLYRFQAANINVGASLIPEVSGYLYDTEVTSLERDVPISQIVTNAPPVYDVSDPGNLPGDNPIVTEDNGYPKVDEIPFAGDPTVYLYDLNLIRDDDDDAGIYIAIESDGTFNSGAVFASVNTLPFQFVGTVSGKTTLGTLDVAPLATVSPGIIDMVSVLTVTLTDGELASVTDAEFYNQDNMILVGNEFIVFRDVNEIAPGQYELTHLLRGQRGTDGFIDEVKTLGSQVVLLRSTGAGRGVQRLVSSVNDLGSNVVIKVVPSGRTIDSVMTEATIVPVGNSFKPYAPGNLLELTPNVSGDLLIGWERRARKFGQLKNDFPVPLVEGVEQYQVEIYDGTPSNVVRTEVVMNISEYNYLAADRIIDGTENATQLGFIISQFSTVVGYGYERDFGLVTLPLI